MKTLTQAGFLLILLFAINQNTIADTFNAPNSSDNGTGSLRQAILDANASGTASTIYLTASTVNLSTPLPAATVNITVYNVNTFINGNGVVSCPIFPASSTGMVTIQYRPLLTSNIASATLSVTNTNSSGPGSLSQCIDYANQTDALDYISFNITGTPPHSVPVNTDSYYPLQIDGSTQSNNGYTGSLPKITLTGSNFYTYGNNSKFVGLTFEVYFSVFKSNATSASNTVVIGQSGKSNLFKNEIWINGATNVTFTYNNYCIDNTSTLVANNKLAAYNCNALTIAHNNICASYIELISDTNTSIYDNRIGTDITGAALVRECNIVVQESIATVIGGYTSGYANTMVGDISITSDSVQVINNKLGVDITGQSNLGIGLVDVGDLSNNAQYSHITIDGNTISTGIRFFSGKKSKVIRNKIGLASDGITSFNINEFGGIKIYPFSDSLEIGRITTGYGNTIAGFQAAVYLYDNTPNRISIRGNSFFGNTLKGIDLTTGGNEGIGKVVITSVNSNTIAGTALPNTFIDIYYKNTENCIAQGKIYINTVSSDASGNWTYTHSSNFNAPNGLVVTQTTQEGNTSEFSEYFPIVAKPILSICKNADTTIGTTTEAGYTYLWSPSTGLSHNNTASTVATVATDSKYYLTMTNSSSCSQTDSVSITVNDPPLLSLTGSAMQACDNGTFDITTSFTDVNSAPGTVSYWQNAATTTVLANPTTVSVAGTYYIKKDNNGCFDTIARIISIYITPDLSVTNPSPVCSPATVDLTATFTDVNNTAGTVTYWADASATSAIINPSTFSLDGTFYIKKDNNGCSDIEPIMVSINTCTETIKETGAEMVRIFPNPTQNVITITSSQSITGYELVNTDGRVVMSSNSFKPEVDLSSLEQGVYSLKLQTPQGESIRKIVKF